ncbi:hypothetical protein GDO81_013434 [Engystomops pustulosus]|uniref:Uncharacterized protein n=1 Tax=Engystomops pustulosus TaxID=76066 RepID=A0AAV7B427_ENGPU|nr:hypothetical protein GDO81_013434 [Engystomops pustulosus]
MMLLPTIFQNADMYCYWCGVLCLLVLICGAVFDAWCLIVMMQRVWTHFAMSSTSSEGNAPAIHLFFTELLVVEMTEPRGHQVHLYGDKIDHNWP